MLIEEGRLLLADPIGKFMPGFDRPQVAVEDGGRFELVPAARPVTVHDLLRHCSGYGYAHTLSGALAERYQQAQIMRRDQSTADQASKLAAMPLAFQPGARWNYGHSTDLLGRIVEVVTGARLGEALTHLIFRPLDMVDTAFSVPAAQHHRLAEPFAKDPDTGAPVSVWAVKEPPQLESGGGGLCSTAADYMRFLAMLAGGGALDGARILARKSIETMSADHLGEARGEPPILPAGYGFGLGFAVRRAAGEAVFPGSAGEYFWSGAAGTSFWIDPKEGLFALFLAQAPGQRMHFRMLFRNLVYASLI